MGVWALALGSSERGKAWGAMQGSLRTRVSTPDPRPRAEGAAAVPALGEHPPWAVLAPLPSSWGTGSLAPRSSLRIYFPYHVLQKTSVARYSEVTSVHCASADKISAVIEI